VLLKVADATGCAASKYITIDISKRPYSEPICMVTVDKTTNKNIIIWQGSGNAGIKEYQIYKETSVAGQYIKTGSVSAADAGVYMDNTSQPGRYAEKYAIMAVDSCDKSSYLSDAHQPIHLQISMGLPGTYNLNWSPYIGFNYSTYYIFKGSSLDLMKQIDSVSSSVTQYTDTSSGLSYYQVAVRRDAPCNTSLLKSTDDVYTEARSNIENTLLSIIPENQPDLSVYVYPNPFDDAFTVEFHLDRMQLLRIEVFNMLGMKIYEYLNEAEAPGRFKQVIKTGESNVSDFYLLKVERDGEIYTTLIIRNR
jgi:hypothetical protein